MGGAGTKGQGMVGVWGGWKKQYSLDQTQRKLSTYLSGRGRGGLSPVPLAERECKTGEESCTGSEACVLGELVTENPERTAMG